MSKTTQAVYDVDTALEMMDAMIAAKDREDLERVAILLLRDPIVGAEALRQYLTDNGIRKEHRRLGKRAWWIAHGPRIEYRDRREAAAGLARDALAELG